jgi:hypothetical protein
MAVVLNVKGCWIFEVVQNLRSECLAEGQVDRGTNFGGGLEQ